MARQFGIITTNTGVSSIVIQSIQIGSSVETAQAMDEHGKIIDINGYGAKNTINIKGLVDGSVSAKAGDVITAEGGSYIITSFQKSESNTGYAEVDVTAEGAPGVTPVAPQTSSAGE